jgi:hypothetical protein
MHDEPGKCVASMRREHGIDIADCPNRATRIVYGSRIGVPVFVLCEDHAQRLVNEGDYSLGPEFPPFDLLDLLKSPTKDPRGRWLDDDPRPEAGDETLAPSRGEAVDSQSV